LELGSEEREEVCRTLSIGPPVALLVAVDGDDDVAGASAAVVVSVVGCRVGKFVVSVGAFVAIVDRMAVGAVVVVAEVESDDLCSRRLYCYDPLAVVLRLVEVLQLVLLADPLVQGPLPLVDRFELLLELVLLRALFALCALCEMLQAVAVVGCYRFLLGQTLV